MDAILNPPASGGLYLPPAYNIPPPSVGSDPASRIRDDPIIQRAADYLMRRMDYHRFDPSAPAPPAGMQDVCLLLADRNSTTHILQRRPGPASEPAPLPVPSPLAAAPVTSNSPASSDGFDEATTTLLEIPRPEAPARTGNARLSLSAHRVAARPAPQEPPTPAPPVDLAPPPATSDEPPPDSSASADVVSPLRSRDPPPARTSTSPAPPADLDPKRRLTFGVPAVAEEAPMPE